MPCQRQRQENQLQHVYRASASIAVPATALPCQRQHHRSIASVSNANASNGTTNNTTYVCALAPQRQRQDDRASASIATIL
eukprot:4651322-Pyramimonas_sp.AAC.1